MVSNFGDGDCGAGEPGASACAFRPPHNPRDYSQFTLGSAHLKFDFWPQPKTLTNIYSLRSFLMIVLYDTRYFKTCFNPYDNPVNLRRCELYACIHRHVANQSLYS